MGRFRVFNENYVISSSDLNQRKNGNEMMRYLREKDPHKLDNNLVVDYNNADIVYFNSYQEFINATKSYLRNNPDCFKCADVPLNIVDGIQSELCYDELYAHVKGCVIDHCNKCEKILKINKCSEGLFPYGHFNNNKKVETFMFPTKVKIDVCDTKKPCQKYIYCKCPPKMDTKCCRYELSFPNQHKHVSTIRYPSMEHKKDYIDNRINENITTFSIFPRFKETRKNYLYKNKQSHIKKPRILRKYNKELQRYEDIELGI